MNKGVIFLSINQRKAFEQNIKVTLQRLQKRTHVSWFIYIKSPPVKFQ